MTLRQLGGLADLVWLQLSYSARVACHLIIVVLEIEDFGFRVA